MKLIVQVICSLLLIAVLVGFREGLMQIADFFGPGFGSGLFFGLFLAIGGYGIICWIDPSSRPRGSSSKQDGPR